MANVPTTSSIITIVENAADLAMQYWDKKIDIALKQDNSPVTEADIALDRYITDALQRLYPDIPIVSEESVNLAESKPSTYYWLVDPIDGTKSFIRGETEFTVNIALIYAGYPVYGVMGQPTNKVIYYGGQDYPTHKITPSGHTSVQCRAIPRQGAFMVRSRSIPTEKLKEYLARYTIKEERRINSSLKFGLIAEGRADIYPRFGRTMEWDTAAGQAIVEGAGGSVKTLDGERFFYSKDGWQNPPFIALGKE